jgi:pimeloyl-ACP methyl ester carboxylesterase
MTDAASPDLGAWLAWGLAQPARQRWLEHDGIRLNLREWGRAGDPGVVLVHGGAAHSHWWDHIGPRLARGRRVVAIDLSGHGDSGWRAEPYRLGAWASEIDAVAQTLRTSDTAAILVGHSLGGLVALKAAMQFPGAFSGAVVLDIVARQIEPEEQARRDRRAGRSGRLFETRQAAIANFRTLPEGGDGQIAAIVRHIAAHSVSQVPGGWSWKNDRSIFLRDALTRESLAPVDFPICLVSAEHGLLPAATATLMARRLGPRATTATMPHAGHHLMLDQPIALTDCLEQRLSSWLRST